MIRMLEGENTEKPFDVQLFLLKPNKLTSLNIN